MRRQRDDQFAMKRADPLAARSGRHSRTRRTPQMARSISPASRTIDRSQLYPERRRHRLIAPLADPASGWSGSRRRRSRRRGRNLLEQLQPFRAHAVFESGESGGIAARARQALDEAGADRIGTRDEYDRYAARHLQQWPRPRRRCQDDVRRERDQLCRHLATVCDRLRPSGLDPHVATIFPTRLLQPLQNAATRA